MTVEIKVTADNVFALHQELLELLAGAPAGTGTPSTQDTRKVVTAAQGTSMARTEKEVSTDVGNADTQSGPGGVEVTEAGKAAIAEFEKAEKPAPRGRPRKTKETSAPPPAPASEAAAKSTAEPSSAPSGTALGTEAAASPSSSDLTFDQVKEKLQILAEDDYDGVCKYLEETHGILGMKDLKANPKAWADITKWCAEKKAS